MAKIAKYSHNVVDRSGMKTQTLNVNLTTELRRYVKDQVRSGRYQNEINNDTSQIFRLVA